MPCKSFFMFLDETNQGERQLIYDIRCRGNLTRIIHLYV